MSGEVRSRAIKALCLIDRGAFADRVIGSFVHGVSSLKKEDSALISEMVLGVLRNRLFLDAVISRHLKKPIGRTEPFALNALRVGAYQILFLDRVPPHAAVFETVEAVRSERGQSLAGFVNGVLKKIVGESVEDLRKAVSPSVLHSIPPWIEKYLFHYFPSGEVTGLMEHFSSRPEKYVRILRGRNIDEVGAELADDGAELIPHPRLPGLYRLEASKPVEELSAFRTGKILMQDTGSFFVASVVADEASSAFPGGGRFMDACAAPGIKASLFRESLTGWEILVNEPSKERMKDMKRNFKRMNLGGFIFHSVDFSNPPPPEVRERFDVVFVDTPCSGLGVMRRNPEVKWRVRGGDIPSFASKSAAILENALGCLREGGVCFYSTCTLAPEENEGVVEEVAFRTGMEIVPPVRVVDREVAFLYDDRYLVTRPDALDGDFFFLAKLVAKGGGGE